MSCKSELKPRNLALQSDSGPLPICDLEFYSFYTLICLGTPPLMPLSSSAVLGSAEGILSWLHADLAEELGSPVPHVLDLLNFGHWEYGEVASNVRNISIVPIRHPQHCISNGSQCGKKRNPVRLAHAKESFALALYPGVSEYLNSVPS